MSRATRCLSLLAVLAILAGCGGPGSFEGTVAGLTLSVKDSVFFVTKNTAGQVEGLSLVMSDQTGMCQKAKANSGLKNATMFLAVMAESDASGNQTITPTAGSYPAWNGTTSATGKLTIAGLVKTDGACLGGTSSFANGGTLTLSGYKGEAGGAMTGTFDFTFPNGEKGKGSFDADFCDATGQTSTCQ